MQFIHIILLVATVLFSSIDAASDSNIARPRADDNPALFENQFTERHLRTYHVADEERELNLQSFPGIKTFTSLFKSKITPNTLMAWAKKNKSPEYVFNKLHLNKAGTNPFHNPDINIWAAYTHAVTPDPEQAMLTFLKEQYQYSDKALAKMFIAARGVKHSKSIVTDLQRVQMNDWLLANVGSSKAYTLLSVKGTTGTSLNRELWRQYMLDLSKIHMNVG